MYEQIQEERVRAWIKDLRSGFFSQTTGQLRVYEGAEGVPTGHCCLGVGACTYQELTDDGYWNENLFVLENSSDEGSWDELHPLRAFFGVSEEVENELAKLNDTGHTFDQIALYIERRLFGGMDHKQAVHRLKTAAKEFAKNQALLKSEPVEPRRTLSHELAGAALPSALPQG